MPTSRCRSFAFYTTLALSTLLMAPDGAGADTVTASSCSQSAVAAAIAAASVGDIVQVPAGNCSWSGLSINKAIHLRGAGVGQTRITLSGNNTVTKQAAGVTRITDFSFSKSGGGTAAKGWTVGGSWQNAQPVIFARNDYVISNSGLFRIEVAGGVIIAESTFRGEWDDSFLQLKDSSDSGGSWRTADTIGTRDVDGRLNIYIESNTFTGGTNQGLDADDAVRLVYRHNTAITSSVNSHGWDTSPVGVRHWEVYDNVFQHPGGNCTTQLCNQNWLILMRGGTGVITDNRFVDIAGSYWGQKAELSFWIRGAEDARPQGSCSNVRYPVPRQVGQNHNGTAYFTDPVRIWNNSGPQDITAEWRFGNPCGLRFSDFWQEGRDYAFSPRPGYQKYPYPHPLLNASNPTPPPPPPPPTPPSAPRNLRVVTQ
ncbi:MAG TPA: hypothetical protein VIL35_05395 [Vicinamibacterales bacterium]